MSSNFHDYKIDFKASLGRGGSCEVFRATGPNGKPVAMKIPLKALSSDTWNPEDPLNPRFQRAAKIWSMLSAQDIPGVVKVYDYGTLPYPWLAMEYLGGGTLLDRITTLSLEEKLGVTRKLLTTLAKVHHLGVIHRDIKPENILFTTTGEPKIADWGLAKALLEVTTRSVGLPRSIPYASPEQNLPEQYGDTDQRTDIYQFGASCYQLFTGEYVFSCQNPIQMIQKSLTEEVQAPSSRKPGIPSYLDDIILGCLGRKKEDRFDSFHVVLHEMKRAGKESGKKKVKKSVERKGKSVASVPSRDVPTVVVSRLGRGDFKTISEAIEKVEEGTRILVQPGIYLEGVIISKAVELVGDGKPGEVVIESRTSNCVQMRTNYAEMRNFTLRCRAGEKDLKYGVDISQGQLLMENCDISSNSIACLAVHGEGSNPIIRNCKIHHGKASGVHVYESGEGLIEGCDIFGNAYSGVAIKEGGNPTVRNCKIHDGKQPGVHVYESGEGLIEGCDIFGNALAGVEIKEGGNPTVRNCKISKNREGLYVLQNGSGTVENCEFSGNRDGAWDIAEGCTVTRRNNKES